MHVFWNQQVAGARAVAPADAIVAGIAAAEPACPNACFDLGVAFSTGTHGVARDLVEAHKWFNLAAVAGRADAALARAEVSEELTAREIAEAQRRARQWLAATAPRAA